MSVRLEIPPAGVCFPSAAKVTATSAGFLGLTGWTTAAPKITAAIVSAVRAKITAA
jgi:hypothetical protein